jgi:hypothetical protein
MLCVAQDVLKPTHARSSIAHCVSSGRPARRTVASSARVPTAPQPSPATRGPRHSEWGLGVDVGHRRERNGGFPRIFWITDIKAFQDTIKHVEGKGCW